ncbi:hypothetical protein [Methylibium sp.]|uniref:hypothetical protein n=1 Tax=Methylibium sp. TaxID=2067992 RepID=UPI0017FB0551|nr:hypothetical protein [Methylibium sp.]MBA3590583.1 hypothetical protein [Methylibium sp.]
MGAVDAEAAAAAATVVSTSDPSLPGVWQAECPCRCVIAAGGAAVRHGDAGASLRLLLAAQPQLVTPVLQVVHRVITRFLLDQAGLKAEQADSGAVTPEHSPSLPGAARRVPAHRR